MGMWDSYSDTQLQSLGGFNSQATEELARRRKAQEAEELRKKSQLQSSEFMREQTKAGLLGAQGRQAPQAMGTTIGQVRTGTAATINTAPQSQFRDRELALADRINAVATGSQMGAGEMAARREGNRAAAQQVGLARSMRGGNAALAARGAATNIGNIGLNTAGQAAQARTQDQQLANQTLAGLLGQGRSADIGLATGQAGLNQQMGLANMDAQNQRIFQQAGLTQGTSLANMQARLQQTGMNDQAALGYLAQLYNVDIAEMQARLQAEQLQMQRDASKMGFGDLLQLGGTLGAAYLTGPVGAAAVAGATGQGK